MPHDKLLCIFSELIYFLFQGSKGSEVLAIDRFRAEWVNNSTKKSSIFIKCSFKSSIKYLIYNCYFKFGNEVLDIICIPITSNSARSMAHLFLY